MWSSLRLEALLEDLGKCFEDLDGVEAARAQPLLPLLLLHLLHLLFDLLLGARPDPLLEGLELVVEGLLVLGVGNLNPATKIGRYFIEFFFIGKISCAYLVKNCAMQALGSMLSCLESSRRYCMAMH